MSAPALRSAGRLLALALLSACGTSDDDRPAGGDAGADAAPIPEPDVPPEVDGRLVINELMADNALTARDESGFAGDWIELYNPTEVDVSLHGYGVTDDLAEPRKAVIPDGVVVPAGGYLVLWLDGEPGRGPDHLGVKLAREGGELGLARPDGSPIDRVRYGGQAVDFSAARAPDGSDLWTIEWLASPGEANPDGAGGPAGLEVPDSAPEEVPAAGDLTEEILGDDVMPEIEILIPPESRAALDAQPRVYAPVTLVFRGRSYGPVGLRLKGGNSFRPLSEKAAFRINIDEYIGGAKFFGLDDLTLNNMVTDYSMMHERAAYWVARQTGMVASRCNHALVTINGEFYGLYSNVETVKSHMMGRWFADATGSLWEATDVDFETRYVDRFEHEGGPDDRTLLIQASEALATGTPSAAIAAASAYIDMAAFQRFWAWGAVVGQFDSFPYSDPGDDYFVYADPGRGQLLFIPWGADETFYSGSHDVKLVRSILATTCMQAPACWDGFVDQAWALLDRLDQIDLLGRMDFIQAQIAPHVSRDLRKPFTDARVRQYQENMRWFVTGRRANLEEMLPPPD